MKTKPSMIAGKALAGAAFFCCDKILMANLLPSGG
jgi:hypothetical protein